MTLNKLLKKAAIPAVALATMLPMKGESAMIDSSVVAQNATSQPLVGISYGSDGVVRGESIGTTYNFDSDLTAGAVYGNNGSIIDSGRGILASPSTLELDSSDNVDDVRQSDGVPVQNYNLSSFSPNFVSDEFSLGGNQYMAFNQGNDIYVMDLVSGATQNTGISLTGLTGLGNVTGGTAYARGPASSLSDLAVLLTHDGDDNIYHFANDATARNGGLEIYNPTIGLFDPQDVTFNGSNLYVASNAGGVQGRVYKLDNFEQFASVPEPSTLALLGIAGAAALASAYGKRKK